MHLRVSPLAVAFFQFTLGIADVLAIGANDCSGLFICLARSMTWCKDVQAIAATQRSSVAKRRSIARHQAASSTPVGVSQPCMRDLADQG